MVRVAVADRGPGVSPEQAQRLFEPYYRAPATAGSGKDGVGLGLSIVKSIVEAHNGQVGVESRRGGGARFWFSLPSVGPLGVREIAPEHRFLAQRRRTDTPMKVLVVDDDVDLLDLMTYALRREGYNVLAAVDGQQALQRWESENPTSSFSMATCRRSTASKSAAASATSPRRRSSCSPRATRKRTSCAACRSAPTTT